MMEDKPLSDMAKFVDSIDPMKPANLLRHAGFVDNGDGTFKINRPVPFASLTPPEVQLRTCEHCKYWFDGNQPKGLGSCSQPDIAGYHERGDSRIFLVPPAGFGCTLFEVKE